MFTRFESARLQGTLQVMVYIDDIIRMNILHQSTYYILHSRLSQYPFVPPLLKCSMVFVIHRHVEFLDFTIS